MKIAICEDNALFATQLQTLVQQFFQSKDLTVSCDLFHSGTDFLQHFAPEHLYDAIFMDIDLGETSDGIEIISKLREMDADVPVIFVTSLENRAIDGYDVHAFGFVAKKNADEKLPKVLEKLWKELFLRKTLAITEKDGTRIIDVDSIAWVESEGRGTLVHTSEGDLTDTRAIGAFSALLPPEDFVEVHKSVFVNIARIKRISTDTVFLADDTPVPLSRRNRKKVMLAVMRKVGGR